MGTTTLDLAPPTFDIAIGDATYTTRPYTNALLVKLAPLTGRRDELTRDATHLRLKAERLNPDGDDVDTALLELQEQSKKHNDEFRQVDHKIALAVLVDDEGKAPPKPLLDEHLGPDGIRRLVRAVLGEDEPDPTQAAPSAA